MPAGAKLPELVLNLVVSQERFDHELARYGLTDPVTGDETEGRWAGVDDDLLRQFCETETGVAVGVWSRHHPCCARRATSGEWWSTVRVWSPTSGGGAACSTAPPEKRSS